MQQQEYTISHKWNSMTTASISFANVEKDYHWNLSKLGRYRTDRPIDKENKKMCS